MHPEVQARLGFQAASREQAMSLGTILLIVLVLILVGVIPTWPHSRSWGYRPTGMVGAILIVLLILLLMGRI
jgi:Na+/melibiose symporter-like transporter